MVMKQIRKNQFLILFIYLAVFLTLSSTWLNEVIPFSDIYLKIFTVLVYMPFVAAIIWKLWADLKDIRKTVKSFINCIYYLFAVYYMIVTVYRFVNGMEVKENLYYSLIFFGAIAFYLMLCAGTIKLSKRELANNLLLISAFFILYRLMYCLFGARFFGNQPININLTSGVTALLLPYIGSLLADNKQSNCKKLLIWAVFCGSGIVVASTGARAIFILTVFNITILIATHLLDKPAVTRIISGALAGCFVVVMLAAMNVGEVRYSLYRQTGIGPSMWGGSGDTSTTETSGENSSTATGTHKDPNNNQNAAQNQINASDRMRRDLLQRGIEQVKQNPLLGSGDVEYYYQVSEKYGFKQSSHNFIIETLICYGGIGLLMIAILFFAIIKETKLFAKATGKMWRHKIVLIQTLGFYFAFGLVQPVVFDSLICLLFVLIVAVCRNELKEIPEQTNA